MSQLYGYPDGSTNSSMNNNDYINALNQSNSNGVSISYSSNMLNAAHNPYNTSSVLGNDYNSAHGSTSNDLVYNSGYVQSTVNQIASDLLQLNDPRAMNSLRGGSSFDVNGTISGTSNLSGILSSVEAAILRSTIPIDIVETEEITVNGQRGIWANRAETINWKGVIPISQYSVNEDSNPEVITKRSQQQLVYQQEVAIRYLRPPTPPAPGEIIIQQEVNTLTPPAPPLVIRQQPPRPVTPQPLVVREAPPQPPAAVGRKVITISGRRIPPPPRKVVIERLAPLPSKPQSVIIERWLPYGQVKRRVIFQKSNERDPVVVKPRNVIIQWEAPQVQVKKEFKDLGVIRANPAEYVARYGATLKTARELPSFVLEIKPPAGVILAADYQYNPVYELEGDVGALKLVDLDREGLAEYRSLLQRISYNENTGSITYASTGAASHVISEIFGSIDRDHNGRLSVEEAERIFLRLNSRLGRRYGEDDVRQFFHTLDTNRDGYIDLLEFKQAFEKSL